MESQIEFFFLLQTIEHTMSIAESEKVSSDQIQVTENLEERIIQEDATTTTTIIDSKTNESTKTNETIKESKEETEEDPIILSRKEMPSNSATTTTKNSKPLQTLGFSQERTTPNKILDYLYLGDQVDSENNEKLKSLKVTHIINMAFIENPFQDQFKYLKIDVYDSPMQKIFPHFQECFDFIDDGKNIILIIFMFVNYFFLFFFYQSKLVQIMELYYYIVTWGFQEVLRSQLL